MSTDFMELRGSDLEIAAAGVVWRGIVYRESRVILPNGQAAPDAEQCDRFIRALDELELGEAPRVYLRYGALWRSFDSGRPHDDDEPPHWVAQYAAPTPSFLAALAQRELEARGQLRLPILKDDVHEQA